MLRGLLGTNATLVADINLILQLVIIVVLLANAVQARQRGLGVRRTLISLAVVLNALLIIAVMNPSFFRILPFAVRNPGAPVPILLWPHVLLGATGELIGVYLMLTSNLAASNSARPRRVVLRLMLLCWAVALAVGLAVYIRLYA